MCLNEDKLKSKSFKLIKKEIQTSIKQGAGLIIFSGGEPTLNNHLFELIDFSIQLGVKVALHTNGRMFSYDDYCKKISHKNIEYFLVSFHSHNQILNEQITQTKNSYEETRSGIKNLLASNNNVVVSLVISNLNIKHINEIILHHKGIGIKNIRFSWIKPQGKVKVCLRKLTPRFKDNVKYLESGLDLCNSNSIKATISDVPFCVMKKKYHGFVANPLKNRFSLEKEELKIFRKIKELKRKSTKCINCKKNKRCDGFFITYLDLFGDFEFIPIL